MLFYNLATYSPILTGGKQLITTLSLATSLLLSRTMSSTTAGAATASTLGPSISQRLADYKTTELRADLSHLTDGDKRALVKLADTSDLLTNVYYQQIWANAPALRKQLQSDAPKNQTALQELRLFELLRGPWDRSRDNEPFIATVGSKPKGANEDGQLALVTYADAYAKYLVPASALMREAADLVSDKSFAQFLRLRSQSFVSNKYLDSEVAWLKINHSSPLEAAIGPYETYEDELFSYKAFYESILGVRDFAATSLLEKFTASLQLVEDNLPIPAQYRNPSLVPPPIVVINQVYNGGDTSAPLVAAFNLPNDEDAIARAGSKLTMIKNVQQAKFHSVLQPIAQLILPQADLIDVTFDAFFGHVLYHERGPAHSAGLPWDTVRSHLQDLHSAFEEAKADITGLFAAKLLIDRGIIDDITLKQFYTTYLASSFRSIRFGLAEAHGLGQAMQMGYLMAKGAFVHSAGRFEVDVGRMVGAVEALTKEIMLIQGDGSKERAVLFKEEYGVLAPEVKAALERMKSLPVDVEPVWKDMEELRKKYK
ncbi:hypothetical protein BX661DRAFT_182297 [Kickxella alabastrina]|uniref:uncharacterized protein n=1 Tax=Kickxella alabastrina TaxID=61397 RepID=UPI002220F215|nr:uncharacterized protein BX661DRAFT_182297 [Kickxella alabastrina]KAI7827719.1 hypothetical protein BX661DRAFT_182297 [Kickxella alabastrina]